MFAPWHKQIHPSYINKFVQCMFASFYRAINLSTVRIVAMQCTAIVCLFIWLFGEVRGGGRYDRVRSTVDLTSDIASIIFCCILFRLTCILAWVTQNTSNKYIVEWMVNRPYQSIEYFYFHTISCACCAYQDSFPLLVSQTKVHTVIATVIFIQ